MEKKYELTDETIYVRVFTTYRIRALKDFGDVKKGDLGGYVESEDNLSQLNDCWIYDDAVVAGNAIVTNNAKVKDKANVFRNANVGGHAIVSGESFIRGNASISENAHVSENALVSGNANIYGDAYVHGGATVEGSSSVYGFAEVYNNACIDGNAEINGCAHITSCRDWALVDSFGSRERATTFFRCNDGKVRVACGCFYGTIDEFRKRVIETHKNNQFAKEYLALADLMELRFSNVKGE